MELDTSLPIVEQAAQLTRRIARRDGGSGHRAPLLGPVVNLPMPDSELTASLDPQHRDELLRSLLLECLRSQTGTTPLLLVLEDCHWIDPASYVLLEFLGQTRRRPAGADPGDRPPDGGRSVAAVIVVSAPSVNRPPAG